MLTMIGSIAHIGGGLILQRGIGGIAATKADGNKKLEISGPYLQSILGIPALDRPWDLIDRGGAKQPRRALKRHQCQQRRQGRPGLWESIALADQLTCLVQRAADEILVSIIAPSSGDLRSYLRDTYAWYISS